MTKAVAKSKAAPVGNAKDLVPAKRASLLATMAARFNVEPKIFEQTILKTVIKGNPTQEQVVAFLIVANQYGLNPFTREIHAFVQSGAVVPIVGIDGWVNLVTRHPEFDGCELIEHEDDKGTLTAVTCVMYHKRREHAVRITEHMVECRRATEPWKKWPRRMLRHKAYAQAARYAFGFSGIYDEDEAERIKSVGVADAEVVEMDMAAGKESEHSGSFDDAPKPKDFKEPDTPKTDPDDTTREQVRKLAFEVGGGDMEKINGILGAWSAGQGIDKMTGDDLGMVLEVAEERHAEWKKEAAA